MRAGQQLCMRAYPGDRAGQSRLRLWRPGACWLARWECRVHTAVMEQCCRHRGKPMGPCQAPRKGKHHFQLLRFSLLSHGTEWHVGEGWVCKCLATRTDRHLFQAETFTSESPTELHSCECEEVAPLRLWAASFRWLCAWSSQATAHNTSPKSGSGIRDAHGDSELLSNIPATANYSAHRYTAWGRRNFTVKPV